MAELSVTISLLSTSLPVNNALLNSTPADIQGNLPYSTIENALEVPNFANNEIVLRPRVLAFVAKCESGDKHYNIDGSVIRGRVNRFDIGKYQVNLKYHGEQAKKLGLDLFDERDNEAYAIWLYHEQGLYPWRHSSQCWRKYI